MPDALQVGQPVDLTMPSTMALNEWVQCIRLAMFEECLLNSVYTEQFLAARGELLALKNQVKSTNGNVSVEGRLRIRVAGNTEWQEYYCVVETRK